MILSKNRAPSKTTTGKSASSDDSKSKVLELEEYLHKRDFTAAVALLEFKRHTDGRQVKTLEWLAYCYFHNRDHEKALKLYRELLGGDDPDPMYHVYAAACLYYMGLYNDAQVAASAGPKCPLRTRLMFHISHKLGDEAQLMEYHQQLSESTEDQLTLASIHYLRSHFQEATDIYKRLLLENRDFLALNVYVALCYSKLDYYDVSLEILSVLLQAYPDSAFSLNLKVPPTTHHLSCICTSRHHIDMHASCTSRHYTDMQAYMRLQIAGDASCQCWNGVVVLALVGLQPFSAV
jgi:intraflagellar transport protein 56